MRDWVDLVRRARLGRTTKAVAMMLATYADSDGTRVFPGIPRLCVDCELSYKVVQAALDELRNAELIQRVSRTGRRGRADEYQLTVGENIQEHLEILSPSQVRAAAEALRKPSGKQPRGTAGVEVRSADGGTSTHGVTRNGPTSGYGVATPRGTACPPTYHDRVTTTTSHKEEDLRTDVTVPAADEIAAEDLSPAKCEHGLRNHRRPDGTHACALCRRGPPADATVIRFPVDRIA